MRREALTYLVVGVLSTLLDYVMYRAFVLSGLLGINWAKGTSTFISIVATYFASRVIVFQQKKQDTGSVWRFALLYAISLLLNVWVNSAVLFLSQNWQIAGISVGVQVAFLIAATFSACFNFTGMKWFVFKQKANK